MLDAVSKKRARDAEYVRVDKKRKALRGGPTLPDLCNQHVFVASPDLARSDAVANAFRSKSISPCNIEVLCCGSQMFLPRILHTIQHNNDKGNSRLIRQFVPECVRGVGVFVVIVPSNRSCFPSTG